MPRPKGEINKEYVGLRMDEKMVSEVDKRAEREHSSRSQIIVDAVSKYLSSKKCAVCGALLPGESKFCSCCGNKLYLEEELRKAANEIMKQYLTDKKIPVGDIGNGFIVSYDVAGRVDKNWRYDRYGAFFDMPMMITTPNGDVGFATGGEHRGYMIPLSSVLNYLKSNEYSVEIEDGVVVTVNIKRDGRIVVWHPETESDEDKTKK